MLISILLVVLKWIGTGVDGTGGMGFWSEIELQNS